LSFAWISRALFCLLLLSVLSKSTAAQGDGLPDFSAQCGCRWAISADLLYWYPSEEVTAIWADVITSGDNRKSWTAPGFDFTWDLGFRVGIGYHLIYDQWDIALYWTHFRTDAKHELSSKPNVSIGPEFFAALLSGNTPRSMSVKWSLLLNMFDWELGKRYCICSNLSLRPFIGLKGGWINQSIHARYGDLIVSLIFPTNESAKERLKNNFWGIGPLGGVNTKWGAHSLHLFGDFSVATMWGTWSCSDLYKTSFSTTSSVNTKNSHLGALMFQGFMGVGWDVDFCLGKFRFSTKLGYEMQLWLNQLRIATFQLQRLHGDLTFMGVTLRCRFDF